MTEELDRAVAAASEGDGIAMRSLYAELAPRVVGYLELRGARDPEALTNDVFIRVLRQLPTVHGGWRGFRALVFTIAHGCLVDDLRQRDHQPRLEAYDDLADGRSHVSAETEVLERDGPALAVLELLPEDQRSVVVLRVLGDLSIKETATVLGRSEPAVKKLQARALSSLRKLLEAR